MRLLISFVFVTSKTKILFNSLNNKFTKDILFLTFEFLFDFIAPMHFIEINIFILK